MRVAMSEVIVYLLRDFPSESFQPLCRLIVMKGRIESACVGNIFCMERLIWGFDSLS